MEINKHIWTHICSTRHNHTPDSAVYLDTTTCKMKVWQHVGEGGGTSWYVLPWKRGKETVLEVIQLYREGLNNTDSILVYPLLDYQRLLLVEHLGDYSKKILIYHVLVMY